jgi:hypothetical protein
VEDNYSPDSVILKGNTIGMMLDAAWGSTYTPRTVWTTPGAISYLDTSNNRITELWVNMGIQDSVTYTPTENGLLHNTGPTAPAWITTDYYGNPRTSGGAADIGAVERQAAIPAGKIKKRKVRWVVQ